MTEQQKTKYNQNILDNFWVFCWALVTIVAVLKIVS